MRVQQGGPGISSWLALLQVFPHAARLAFLNSFPLLTRSLLLMGPFAALLGHSSPSSATHKALLMKNRYAAAAPERAEPLERVPHDRRGDTPPRGGHRRPGTPRPRARVEPLHCGEIREDVPTAERVERVPHDRRGESIQREEDRPVVVEADRIVPPRRGGCLCVAPVRGSAKPVSPAAGKRGR